MRPGSGQVTVQQLNWPGMVVDAAAAVESELRALGLPVRREESVDASGQWRTVTLKWKEEL